MYSTWQRDCADVAELSWRGEEMILDDLGGPSVIMGVLVRGRQDSQSQWEI